MARTTNFGKTVREYYKHIDEGAIGKALALFSHKIRYQRQGRMIEGIEELARFYNSERDLQGKHEIASVRTIKPGLVRVTGKFINENRELLGAEAPSVLLVSA